MKLESWEGYELETSQFTSKNADNYTTKSVNLVRKNWLFLQMNSCNAENIEKKAFLTQFGWL